MWRWHEFVLVAVDELRVKVLRLDFILAIDCKLFNMAYI